MRLRKKLAVVYERYTHNISISALQYICLPVRTAFLLALCLFGNQKCELTVGADFLRKSGVRGLIFGKNLSSIIQM